MVSADRTTGIDGDSDRQALLEKSFCYYPLQYCKTKVYEVWTGNGTGSARRVRQPGGVFLEAFPGGGSGSGSVGGTGESGMGMGMRSWIMD